MMGSYASAVVCLSLLGTTPDGLTSSQLTWESDYGKALAATRQNDLPLVVILDSESNRQSAIRTVSLEGESTVQPSEELLQAFVRCHVDVSSDYGKQVAKAFRVTSFPHMAIIDKTGRKIIYRKTGHLSNDQLHTTLSNHRQGLVPVATAAVTTNSSVQSGGYLDYFQPQGNCPSCQRYR